MTPPPRQQQALPGVQVDGSTVAILTRDELAAEAAKRHNGTSCHQCKNIKVSPRHDVTSLPPSPQPRLQHYQTEEKLAFCTHLLDKRSKPEKRVACLRLPFDLVPRNEKISNP